MRQLSSISAVNRRGLLLVAVVFLLGLGMHSAEANGAKPSRWENVPRKARTVVETSAKGFLAWSLGRGQRLGKLYAKEKQAGAEMGYWAPYSLRIVVRRNGGGYTGFIEHFGEQRFLNTHGRHGWYPVRVAGFAKDNKGRLVKTGPWKTASKYGPGDYRALEMFNE